MTNKKMEIDPHIIATVKNYMLRHIGSANSVAYGALTEFIYGKDTENYRRMTRAVISAINADQSNGLLICSDRTDGGVFLNGSSEEDIEKHVRFAVEERAQAMSTLQKVHAYEHKVCQLYGSEVISPRPGQGRLC